MRCGDLCMIIAGSMIFSSTAVELRFVSSVVQGVPFGSSSLSLFEALQSRFREEDLGCFLFNEK